MNSDMTKERKKELAERIMTLARKQIVMDSPALLMAVYALQPKEKEEKESISTDGVYICYHTDQVITDFRKRASSITEQILHVTMHCLLGHLKEREHYNDKRLYDMIADCKVAEFTANICKNMGGHWIHNVPYTLYQYGSFTNQIYDGFSKYKMTRSTLLKDKKKLMVDDHNLWKQEITEIPAFCGQEGDGKISSGNKGPDWKGIRAEFSEKTKKNGKWGDVAGCFAEDVGMAEENGISYDMFLRRFTKNREQMKTDPDSIDFKWYHVGMEYYGDMPILEPMECNDMPSCDRIVIAVDTSGSCAGEVCSRFLRETLHLLEDISEHGDKMNVTLLQCDTMIQEEIHITSKKEIKTAMEAFQPKGFGGTDFRPVFDWIKERQRYGEKIQALLYLSDGAGEFPKEIPDYPVAFLLYDTDEWTVEEMPKWITSLYLDTDRFTIKEATA
ncbi:MAG: hypothetical protein IKT73_09110 [Anaerotignum sp.]|nr:hypothetical protein [Anaerotignum sp.]